MKFRKHEAVHIGYDLIGEPDEMTFSRAKEIFSNTSYGGVSILDLLKARFPAPISIDIDGDNSDTDMFYQIDIKWPRRYTLEITPRETSPRPEDNIETPLLSEDDVHSKRCIIS
jgi:hypothetical protein